MVKQGSRISFLILETKLYDFESTFCWFLGFCQDESERNCRGGSSGGRETSVCEL